VLKRRRTAPPAVANPATRYAIPVSAKNAADAVVARASAASKWIIPAHRPVQSPIHTTRSAARATSWPAARKASDHSQEDVCSVFNRFPGKSRPVVAVMQKIGIFHFFFRDRRLRLYTELFTAQSLATNSTVLGLERVRASSTIRPSPPFLLAEETGSAWLRHPTFIP